MSGILVVGGEVDGRAGMSVRIRAGVIRAIASDLEPVPDETVLDAAGGAVIPGLHDHHVHLRSAVAARGSVPLDPASVTRAGGLTAALQTAAALLPTGAWLRGVGAHGAVFESLDRPGLDAIIGDRPVRVQHRSGAHWLVNSVAAEQLGISGWTDAGVERFADGSPTGRLWRVDERMSASLADDRGDQAPGLAELSQAALALGITGFTDATPGRDATDAADLVARVAAGQIRQRLTLMADPAIRLPPNSTVTIGPRKVMLDDDAIPSVAGLAEVVDRAHRAGAAVAVHCVSAEQLVVTVAALEAAGVRRGDRIEHASIVPPGYAQTIAALGITVVTQPGFLAARGDDYRRDVSAEEQPWLYPSRSLLAAGVAVGASSDLPFGPLDPWLAMKTATTRRAASGAVVGRGERIDARQALTLYLGRPDAPGEPRRVALDQPGDLCVLREPLSVVLADLSAHHVAAVTLGDEAIDFRR